MKHHMRESRAIVTVAMGNGGAEMLKESEASLRQYARVCRADFIVLDQPSGRYPIPTYERFQVTEVLESYDRVLYLDCDVLALPDAEDVFAVVSRGSLGATLVLSPPLLVPPAAEAFMKDMQAAERVFGPIGNSKGYFNAGVLLLEKHHSQLLAEARDLSAEWYAERPGFHDQTLLNYLVAKRAVNVHDLGAPFNFTIAFRRPAERFAASIVHYAGVGHRRGSRIVQMRKDWNIMRSRWALSARRRLPSLSLFADRI